MKILISFMFSFFCSMVYAAPINWTIATTSFPADQSIGDTGQEKVPYGHLDLMSGNLVFDIPEVTLKGNRGLDLMLSRSYGKVNNGFRSMGNWELEIPRIVMMTGASTKLQGDYNGDGICQTNGDYSNEKNNTGIPIYYTSILDSGYKNEVTSSYIELTNANYLRNLASALQSTIGNPIRLSASDYDYNRTQAQNIYYGINSSNNTAKVAANFQDFTDGLIARNQNNINLLTAHLSTLSYLLSHHIDNNSITRVDITASGTINRYSKGSYSTSQFVDTILIPAVNGFVAQRFKS